MRIAGIVLTFALTAACVSGCKTKGDADGAPDQAALKAQQELLARRDKLLEKRQELQTKASEMDLVIQKIEQSGGDASEAKKQKADIDSQLKDANSSELAQINTNIAAMKQSGDRAAQMASREAEVANREAQVASRERSIAEREKSLIQRDSDLAQRWKDSCATSSGPVIIQQAPPSKGGNYSKKDVSDLIARARAGMAKKGLLTADLPGPAQAMESEAGKALNDNDTSKAYFVANQLVGMVDSIQINRSFIQLKMARVQAQIKASKQDDATNQQLGGILSQVITSFGEQKFEAANKQLNQLVAMLR
ncbi:hypothetical protein BH11MYX1_BH11MYX1_26660 [soil metagenome]